MEIGTLKLKSDLVFAPIAGFSDVGFRHLCSGFGAGLTYTELVSAKGIVYNNKGTQELISTLDSPCAVQLFGHEPEFMYKAAKDSSLPISAVAEQVGISDYNYFSKVFRTMTGTTPSAFRKQARG